MTSRTSGSLSWTPVLTTCLDRVEFLPWVEYNTRRLPRVHAARCHVSAAHRTAHAPCADARSSNADARSSKGRICACLSHLLAPLPTIRVVVSCIP